MLKKTKKLLVSLIVAIALFAIPGTVLGASSNSYTVVPNDTLWKIAVKTKTGIHEIISANPQISNINLIYPG